MAEGMALDDTEKIEQDMETTILFRDQPACMRADLHMPIWPSDPEAFSPRPVDKPTAGSSSSNVSHKHTYGIKAWANVLVGSTPPTPRAKTSKTRHKSAQRLGVGIISNNICQT